MSTSENTSNKIQIACKGATVVALEQLQEFQGKLKHLTKQNHDRLRKLILAKGFCAPIFVWRREDGTQKIIDGHQRLRVLHTLRSEGYEIPLLPVDYIDADSEVDAREKLLSISSQFGEWDLDELDTWLREVDESVAETLRLVEGEIEIVDTSDTADVESQIRSESVKPYDKVHILLSMSQDVFFESQEQIRAIKALDGIEYEQSQN